jgi:hypothetical protein
LKVLQIGKSSILNFFIKNGFLAHSAKIFQNSKHQKILLARLYHRAKFQQNRSTIERFINNLNFFSTQKNKLGMSLELNWLEMDPWFLWEK